MAPQVDPYIRRRYEDMALCIHVDIDADRGLLCYYTPWLDQIMERFDLPEEYRLRHSLVATDAQGRHIGRSGAVKNTLTYYNPLNQEQQRIYRSQSREAKRKSLLFSGNFRDLVQGVDDSDTETTSDREEFRSSRGTDVRSSQVGALCSSKDSSLGRQLWGCSFDHTEHSGEMSSGVEVVSPANQPAGKTGMEGRAEELGSGKMVRDSPTDANRPKLKSKSDVSPTTSQHSETQLNSCTSTQHPKTQLESQMTTQHPETQPNSDVPPTTAELNKTQPRSDVTLATVERPSKTPLRSEISPKPLAAAEDMSEEGMLDSVCMPSNEAVPALVAECVCEDPMHASEDSRPNSRCTRLDHNHRNCPSRPQESEAIVKQKANSVPNTEEATAQLADKSTSRTRKSFCTIL